MTKAYDRAAVEQMFRQSVEDLKAGKTREFLAVFDPEAVIEFPYMAENFPNRYEGIEAISRIYEHLPLEMDRVEYKHMRHCDDVLIVEYDGFGSLKASGRRFHQKYVAIWKIRDSKVIHYTEYWNPTILSEETLEW